jgi:AcrR family transcriptional regulator
MPTATLTREESKALTRKRLIEASLRLLGSDTDSRNLTTGNIAREAGVAQPTFYVHFRDMDDLLTAVVEARMHELRVAFNESRVAIELGALSPGGPDEALRAAFRVPLRAILDRPQLFKIYVQERLHRDSPLGRYCHMISAELRGDLAKDLLVWAELSERNQTPNEVDILAYGFSGMVETVALGYLDGKFDDVEEMIDVLVRFARGALG